LQQTQQGGGHLKFNGRGIYALRLATTKVQGLLEDAHQETGHQGAVQVILRLALVLVRAHVLEEQVGRGQSLLQTGRLRENSQCYEAQDGHSGTDQQIHVLALKSMVAGTSLTHALGRAEGDSRAVQTGNRGVQPVSNSI